MNVMAERRDSATVEVVYALPDAQSIVQIAYRPGMTALDAVERSGVIDRFELDLHSVVLGVFGVRVARDHVLAPGDRVEVCRPLQADPRDMRRDLAARGRVMGGGDNEET